MPRWQANLFVSASLSPILITNVQYNLLGMTGRRPAAVRNLCIILGNVNSSF